MKKNLICLAIGMLFTPTMLLAQLKVQNDGTTKGTIFYSNTVKNNETVFSKRVGLSLPNNTQTPKSLLSIGTFGKTSTTMDLLYKTKVGIEISSNVNPSGEPQADFFYSIGLQSLATKSSLTPSYNPFNISIRGLAGSPVSISDYRSYGVSALLHGPKGTALYAGTTPYEFTHNGKYAAYINGNATVQNGTLNAVVTQTNDSTLMQSVIELDEADVFDKLDQLQAVQYTLQNPTYNCPYLTTEGIKKDTTLNRFSSDFASRIRYGFAATQFGSVFPELVYTLPDETEGVDYTALVPVLSEGLKIEHQTTMLLQDSLAQLSAQLQQTQTLLIKTISELEALKKAVYKQEPAQQPQGDMPVLSQNTPNPFSESTEIAIYLPASVQTAYLFIYNLSGEEQEEFVLNERGNITQTIEAGSFIAGHYIYTLVVDGSVVDSKHLILTK